MSRYRVLFSVFGAASALAAPADLPHPNPIDSFWTYGPGANPLAREGSTGELTEEADVGVTGTKLRAVILEARDFCSGATGNLTPSEPKKNSGEATLRFYAIERYTSTEMARVARTAGWADAVDFVEGGHMDVMLTQDGVDEVQADFDAAVAAWKNVNVTWLTREEMQSTYGTYNWGVRSPGYNLWPLKFVTPVQGGECHLTRARPAPPYPHTCTGITSSSTRRWALKTPRGSGQCSYVLHATNGYASHILPHMAGPAGIIPVRGQVIAVRANATLSTLSETSWVENGGYWFPRPVVANENPLVTFGGARDDVGPPFEEYVADDSAVNPGVGATLRAFLPKMFLGLYAEDREPEREWAVVGMFGAEITGRKWVAPE
ncbi:hypothetical protein C8R44DRAFT_822273, partial [Mycena epipterygia]